MSNNKKIRAPLSKAGSRCFSYSIKAPWKDYQHISGWIDADSKGAALAKLVQKYDLVDMGDITELEDQGTWEAFLNDVGNLD